MRLSNMEGDNLPLMTHYFYIGFIVQPDSQDIRLASNPIFRALDDDAISAVFFLGADQTVNLL